MVSKTSLLEAVKAFDWRAVDAGLKERPDLLSHREEREKNWLHVLCSTKLKGRKPADSIKTADVLLERNRSPRACFHGRDVEGDSRVVVRVMGAQPVAGGAPAEARRDPGLLHVRRVLE